MQTTTTTTEATAAHLPEPVDPALHGTLRVVASLHRASTPTSRRFGGVGRLGSLNRIAAVFTTLIMSACASGPARIDTNYTSVSQDSRVQFIVLHYTEGNFPVSLKTLTEGAVSSHYLVAQDPVVVYRLVDESRRAYHAGVSSWEGMTGLNASSIGIEIVNRGYIGDASGPYHPYPEAQIEQVLALVKDIAQRHGVKPNRIVGHSDIAPSRKVDPGPAFPWPRLAAAGLIPWPDAAQVAAQRVVFEAAPLPDIAWYQQALASHGYAVPRHGLLDQATRDVLRAFQMRYRPTLYAGEPDGETAALLQVIATPGGLLLVGADGRTRPFQRGE